MNDRYIGINQPQNQLFKPWPQPQPKQPHHHHHHCHDGGLHKLPAGQPIQKPFLPLQGDPSGTYTGWMDENGGNAATTNTGTRAGRIKDVYVPSSKR